MKKRILIVDDEPNVRLGYRITLEMEGFDVCEANGAAEALKALSEGRFDLATLDMRMPEMDGLDLLARMREENLNTPAVIITAYGDVPDAVRAMKLGAIDFLQKPLTPDMLRRVVNEILLRHAPVTEQEPNDFYSHLEAAKRLINLQDFANAREHVHRALACADSADACNMAGVLFEMNGDYDNARKYYGKAVALDKNCERAQENLHRLIESSNSGSGKGSLNPAD